MKSTPSPKFTIGQTVYYPALALGHDCSISRCEVVELRVQEYKEKLLHAPGPVFICTRPGKNYWKAHKPESIFATHAEATARLKEKLQSRITKLQEALNLIDIQQQLSKPPSPQRYMVFGPHSPSGKELSQEQLQEWEEELKKVFASYTREQTSDSFIKVKAGGFTFLIQPIAEYA